MPGHCMFRHRYVDTTLSPRCKKSDEHTGHIKTIKCFWTILDMNALYQPRIANFVNDGTMRNFGE